MASDQFPDTDDPRSIQLTGRDIDDAQRLLSLLLSRDRVRYVIPPGDAASTPAQLLRQRARETLERRRERARIFGPAMFGEPGWEMLLWLFALDTGARQPISRLAEMSGAPKSTALRWIEYLETQGLVRRDAHPTDKRAAFVELTDKGRRSMMMYLNGTGESRGSD